MIRYKFLPSFNKFCGEGSEWQGSPAYLELTEVSIQSLAIKTERKGRIWLQFLSHGHKAFYLMPKASPPTEIYAAEHHDH